MGCISCFTVSGLGFGFWDLAVWVLGFRFRGLGFESQSAGFRVYRADEGEASAHVLVAV